MYLSVQETSSNIFSAGELFLPASTKWVTGTIKRRPVLCYLYSNALVVIAKDKKVRGMLSPSHSVRHNNYVHFKV